MGQFKKYFNLKLNEGKKKIKKFSEVKIGDMAYENPDAGGEWDNDLGEVLWKGDYKELTKSKYKKLIQDWEVEDEDEREDEMNNYDLIVIDDGGPTLFNYDGDPSGCVVFK